MEQKSLDEQIRGQTMRWEWTEGPTAGQTHEHAFHSDGTMDWRVLDGAKAGTTGHEKRYAAVEVTEDVHVVSYLAESGFTVTAVLNFRDGSIVGFASSSKEWFPVRGTFEVPRAHARPGEKQR